MEEARDILEKVELEDLKEIKLFDIYKDLENQRKSLAFKIIFQSQEKTLSDDFANEQMEKVYKVLEENNFEVR